MSRPAVTAALALALVCAPSSRRLRRTPASQAPKTTFRSTVDVVSVAAVVRDKRGRFARNLKKEDFVVEEGGARREILEFHADDNAPVRVALLFDVSGSMRLADRARGRAAGGAPRAQRAAARLRGGRRGGGVQLRHEPAVAAAVHRRRRRDRERARARRRPTARPPSMTRSRRPRAASPTPGPGDPHRRAVVVFTDGIDTSSQLTPEQVSAIASEIDVPVYVMTVVSPSDHEDRGAHGAAPESAAAHAGAVDRRRSVRDERARARERGGAADRRRAAPSVRAGVHRLARPRAGTHST